MIYYLDYARNKATQPFYVEVTPSNELGGEFVGALGTPKVPATDAW